MGGILEHYSLVQPQLYSQPINDRIPRITMKYIARIEDRTGEEPNKIAPKNSNFYETVLHCHEKIKFVP